MEEINKIITVKKGNRDYPESLSTLEDVRKRFTASETYR